MKRAATALASALVFLASAAASSALAGTPSFSNLVSGQVKDITTDFASNFMHSTASPPSSFSRLGLELGAVAGATRTKRLSGIAGSNLTALPHGGLLFIGHSPWCAIEATAIPRIERSGVSFENYTGGLRKILIGEKSALTLSGRLHYTLTRVGYAQTVLGETVNVALDSRTFGADLIGGYRILLLELFAGLGAATSRGTLGFSGKTGIFDLSTIPDTSFSSTAAGPTVLAGAQLYLPLLTLAAEYSNVYSNHRFTAKAAIRLPPF